VGRGRREPGPYQPPTEWPGGGMVGAGCSGLNGGRVTVNDAGRGCLQHSRPTSQTLNERVEHVTGYHGGSRVQAED
jgi:hypothetical protein